MVQIGLFKASESKDSCANQEEDTHRDMSFFLVHTNPVHRNGHIYPEVTLTSLPDSDRQSESNQQCSLTQNFSAHCITDFYC